MSDKSELKTARTEMLAVLDKKLADMPEWRAFRAIERAISAVQVSSSTSNASSSKSARTQNKTGPASYGDVAVKAIREAGMPLKTDDLVDAVKLARPDITMDTPRLKINVQSAMSRDKRIKSILWGGGTARAWWLAGRPEPVNHAAGTLLEVPAAH